MVAPSSTSRQANREVPTESQADLFSGAPVGRKVTLHFVRSAPNLAAFYEGDLAISGKVGRFQFEAKPVNLCCIDLLEGMRDDINECLRLDGAVAVGNRVIEIYSTFCGYAYDVRDIAHRSVVSDPSRLTTVLGFLANYQWTVLKICRLVLGDGTTEHPGDVVVRIDKNLAGLERFDGAGVDWGYSIRPDVSAIPRTDLSRGLQYLSGQPDATSRDESRLNDLLTRLAGNEASSYSHVPNAVYGPLADAFRASVKSITMHVSLAAAAWRDAARAAHKRKLEDAGEEAI